ncbi:hypothetical protein JX265_000426 [Neoarthrinium moseri]|uniref:Uncharacterized protein n=1 Tax=Neoarthrinium moseri TaxID=1658444 RepID=A0A9P9WYH0_9PEZI|nr:uncharacterized protein JN550_000676 [Neoarthrinium moseri]KAI1851340.1 hypothetical protein JX266_003415 [Neoarthrinium moseri]KAI1878494.1 hypothetical protein JN550_000676 [Neoarthrinium moseri]KAI1881600.1 hypothetical protein JX265_000426 [Neoarthrinium moseri]
MSETSTLVDWSPTDTQDEQLKETINQLWVVPTEKVIKEVPVVNEQHEVVAQKPQFILKTRGYYGENEPLPTTFEVGMLFPKTNDEFSELYPADKMKKLTDLDDDIYTETRNTMVAIQNSCQNFNDNAMSKWLLVTNQTIEYSQYAIELLTGFGESSFKAQLEVLLDDKYSTPESQNDATFQNTAQMANELLKELSKNAQEKATEVGKLIGQLQAFLGETTANKARIDFLRKQYYNGPVTVGRTNMPKMGKDGKPQEPYAKWLQSELEALREEIRKAFNDYNKTFEDWKHYTTVAVTAVTYIWIPVAGFIAGSVVMGVYADRARKAHNLYEEQKKYAFDKAGEEAPLVKLLEDISMLTSQHEDMATKMQSAIDALGEIKLLFLDQSRNFGLAASMMGLAEGKLRSSLFLRKKFLQTAVDKAVVNWQQVADLAKEFLATADVNTVGITKDVTPPKAE